MTRIVDLILILVATVTAVVWLPRMVSRGRHRTDWRARFGHTELLGPPPAAGRIVLHAVSVGEAGAIRGLVQQLAQSGVDVVIASTTDTGVGRARELFGARHTVVRWPLDFSWAVRRFLNSIRPTAVGLVELEVWPNLTAICQKRRIPSGGSQWTTLRSKSSSIRLDSAVCAADVSQTCCGGSPDARGR